MPRGLSPMSAEAAWRLKSWGSQMDLVDEFETGFLLLNRQNLRAAFWIRKLA